MKPNASTIFSTKLKHSPKLPFLHQSGHVKVLEKSPGIIRLIESGITGAKRQRFNDLLSEIKDFYETVETEELDTIPPLGSHLIQPEMMEVTSTNTQEPEGRPPTVRTMLDQPDTVSIPTLIPTEPPIHDDNETPPETNQDIHNDLLNIPITPTVTQEPTTTAVRRSTRTGAQKPQGFYSRLHSGESVADYTACHMRAHECATLYGGEETEKAGATEVTNMIEVRKAAEPVDYRKLSQRVIMEALPSFLFFKAKDLLPGDNPTTEDEDQYSSQEGSNDNASTDWTLVKSKRHKRKHASHKRKKKKAHLRGRWVGGGNKQQRGEVLAERIAPTARGTTHNLIMGIAAFEGRKLRVGDIPSAYLQGDHVPSNGRPVYIIADRYVTSLIVKNLPKYKDYVRPNGTMVLRVKKAMYGLVESAWLWYKEFEKQLTSIGYSVSIHDRDYSLKRL